MRNLALTALVGAAVIACDPYKDVVQYDSDSGFANDVDNDGFSSSEGDCNDEDPLTYPGAWDVVADGIDRNCDGVPGIDNDLDERAWTGSGGVDCNDDDPTVYGATDTSPGAEEIGWDGIDQNCDLEDRHDFLQICGGEDHTCALDSARRIRCWGRDDLQVRNAPSFSEDVDWVSLSCGYESACAVSDEGELRCWGKESGEQGLVVSTAPTDETGWRQVFMGAYHGCVLDEFGNFECWGLDDDGQVSEAPNGAQFQGMGLGEEHSCGIRGSRRIMECWGAEGAGDLVSNQPDANYFEGWLGITGGNEFACGVRQDLGRTCWGDNLNGNAPFNEAGPWSQLSAGRRFVCGIKELELTCVGEENPYKVLTLTPLGIDFRFVGVGAEHVCAIRQANGEPMCWGKNQFGESTVPVWPNVAW